MLKKIWARLHSPGSMAALAIVGFGLAIYQGFFYEKRGQLEIVVDPPTRVFDIHQPVGGLEVSYAGENLRTARKALWIITASVKNAGNAEIKKGDFAEESPAGLRVAGGVIVERPNLTTSVDYLQQHLRLNAKDSTLLLNPAIWEPQDTVHLNFLVLGQESTKPTVSGIGKLAGHRSIGVTTAEAKKPSGWNQVFEGSTWWVHAVRAPAYAIAGLLSLCLSVAVMVAVVAPFAWLLDLRDKQKRKAAMQKFGIGNYLSSQRNFVAHQYIEDGPSGIARLRGAISYNERASRLLEQLKNTLPPQEIEPTLKTHITPPLYTQEMLQQLVASGLATPAPPLYEVKAEVSKEIEVLMRHLQLSEDEIGKLERQHSMMAERIAADHLHGRRFDPD